MPNINDTRGILEAEFISQWGLTTEIAFDNSVFDDTVVDEYVGMRFLLTTTENVAIGSGLHKCVRHYGRLSIVVNISLNQGSGKAWEYADQIRVIMENKCLSSGVFTTASETRRNGDTKDGWYSVICSIPFTSDENN